MPASGKTSKKPLKPYKVVSDLYRKDTDGRRFGQGRARQGFRNGAESGEFSEGAGRAGEGGM